MSFKFSTETPSIDPDLTGWVWLNKSAQSHFFVSILHTKYPTHLFPQMWERYPKITCKPHRAVVLPHRYYKIFTRDDSPAVGSEMTMNEAIEELAPNTLYRGEEANENFHEKKK